jgi:hypothetical protein
LDITGNFQIALHCYSVGYFQHQYYEQNQSAIKMKIDRDAVNGALFVGVIEAESTEEKNHDSQQQQHASRRAKLSSRAQVNS